MSSDWSGGPSSPLLSRGPEGGLEGRRLPEGERYQRLGAVGEGGMGRVYLGYDAWLDRNVAIKVPTGGAAHDAVLRREATFAARLDHPNIAAIHDIGEDAEGRAFFVMRWLAGESLHSLRSRGQTGAALRAVRIAAEAMGHAHGRGVVHRDLSPANILVAEHGAVCVIDWGLAADVGEAGAPARVGTPGFSAPEQAQGGPPQPTADVWSLGALVRYAAGPTAAPELEAIAARATAAAPADRYATAADLARDLAAWEDGRLVGAYAYPLGVLLRRALWRHRAVLGLAALAGSVVLAQALQQARALAAETERALEAEQRAVTALAGARAEQAAAAFTTGDDARAHASALEALALAANPLAEGVRAATWQSAALRERRRSALPACPSWQLHGELLLCVDAEAAQVRAWREDWLWRFEGLTVDARLAPDGLVLLLSDRSAVRLDPESGAVLERDPRLGEFRGRSAERADLSRAGLLDAEAPAPCIGIVATELQDPSKGLISCEDGSVWRLDGAKPEQLRAPAPAIVSHLVASDAGQWAATRDGALLRLDATANSPTLGEPVAAMLPRPGGAEVLVLGERGRARLLAADGQWALDLPPDAHALSWTAEGHLNRIEGDVLIEAALPALIRSRYHHAHGLSSLDWRADSQALLLADGGSQVVLLPLHGAPVQALRWQDRVVKHALFRPDGGIATGAIGSAGITRFSETLQPQAPLDSVDVRYRRLAARPDGSLIGAHYGRGLHQWSPDGELTIALPEAVWHDLGSDLPGRALAMAGDQGVWVWPDGGSPRRVHPGNSRAVDAEGERWAAALGTELVVGERRFETGHVIVDLCFVGPERIATGGEDGWVRLWSLEGALLRELQAHSSLVSAVLPSPDGRYLASAGWDGAVVLMSLESEGGS